MFFVVIPISSIFIIERQQGTLQRLRAMGVPFRLILAGKLLPFFVVNQVQAVMMVLAFILGALSWAGTVRMWQVMTLAFLLGAAQAMSLFADRQLIEIRIPSGKPGKDGSQALQQIAEAAQGNDSTLTLVLLPRLDMATQKGAWFAALESKALFCQLWPISEQELPRWIEQRKCDVPCALSRWCK